MRRSTSTDSAMRRTQRSARPRRRVRRRRSWQRSGCGAPRKPRAICRTARDTLAEYSEHYTSALTAKRKYEAIGKQLEQMPTWRRDVQRGRGAKHFDFTYRLSIYAQYENGTPRSAIGDNIMAIVRRTAPWLNPQKPSLRMLGDCRFEMRTIDEALSGREVAAAHRVRQLGNDESSKYGNTAITSNVIIEPTPGADLQVVVLRGVYCSAGGTAEAITNAINLNCFARLRDLQRRWRKQFEKMYPRRAMDGA